jgi:uncharacterized protein
MKATVKLILLTTFLTICINHVKAQTTATQFTPEHLHAAERVIDATDVVQNVQKIFEAVIEKQAAQVPEEKRTAFVDVMHKFFGKYGTDEQIRKIFIPIYAADFSEDELNQIADFLSTPAGKALLEKQPDLVNKRLTWGQKISEEHKAELQAMLQEAFKDK